MYKNPRRKRPAVRIFHGCTFDDMQFTVALDYALVVGKGGTATIYRGEMQGDPPLTVAVKVFDQIITNVEKELLLRELRATRQVSFSHDLILGYIGTVDIGRETAIVSLYMENGNLMQYIQDNQDCNKTKLIRQVAEALNFLHATKNIIHGDIKSANILISDSGDALLSDFGLSTFIDKNNEALPTMTAIRDMYTLRFAAPELVTGGSPAEHAGSESESACLPTTAEVDSATKQPSKTRASDVYAFGMLILEVVTEKPPWHGLNHAAVVLRLSTGQHPSRPLNGPLVAMSHLTWELCLNCWKTEPDHRIKMEDALEVLRTKSFEIYPAKTMTTKTVVSSIAYMPGGRHVVTGSWSGDVHIWDTHTGLAIVGPMQGHTSPIACVTASPNGLEIASSSFDHAIRRWDAASGTPVGKPIDLGSSACCITYSPDDLRLSCAEGSCVVLWHSRAGGAFGFASKLKGHTLQVNAIAFSPDSTRIASGSADGTVRIWDMATRATLASLKQDNWVDSVAFSPDGATLVAVSSDYALLKWNISSGRLDSTELEGRTDRTGAVTLSPTGNCVAGSVKGTIHLWNPQTGQIIASQLGVFGSGGASMSFSPNGRSLVSASTCRGSFAIWDLFA